MNRLPRSITWIALACLAIAPIGIGLFAAERWTVAFSNPFAQNSALRPPGSVDNHADKNVGGDVANTTENKTDNPSTAVAVWPSPSTASTQPDSPSTPESLAMESPTAQSVNCDNPQSQQEMNHCAYRDYQQADEALNRIYNELLNVVSDAQHHKLIEAEHAWIVYRDKTCDFERSRYEGGSIEPLIFHSCMAQLTQEQTLRLETYLEEY